MTHILGALRVLLFAVSFCGFCCQVNRFAKMPPALVPAFVCCLTGSALLIAGIWNILGYAALAFVLTGLYGFVRALLDGGRFRWLCSPAMLVFLGASIYFYFYLRGHYIRATDDVNQWAVAVRVMLRYDRLPRFTDDIMMFPSYPTGTAGFIYLVCRIMGSESGGTMFFAQAFLLLCCLLPLSALISRNRPVSGGILLLTAIVLLTMNAEASLQTLYVDTLLGIVCVAGIAVAFYYRDAMKTMWPRLLPFGCFLAVVKGSGLYFSLVIAAFCACFLWQQCDRRTRWKAIALLVGLPLSMLLLWNRHADLVFEGGLMTRHSTSLRYMLNQALRKDIGDYAKILSGFAAHLTDIACMRKALCTWLLLACLALAGGRLRPKPPFRPGALLLSSLLLYVTYMLGLLGMYMFNLPEDSIESFTRYEHTILLVLLGLAAIYCVLWCNALPDLPKRRRIACLSAAAALFVAYAVCLQPAVGTLVRYPVEEELSAREFSECVPDRNKETRYLVYVWDGRREQNYGHRMAHYYTYPAKSDIVSMEPEHIALLDSWTETYDYLIAFWKDEAYMQYAEAHGLDPEVRVWSAADYLAAWRPATGATQG